MSNSLDLICSKCFLVSSFKHQIIIISEWPHPQAPWERGPTRGRLTHHALGCKTTLGQGLPWAVRGPPWPVPGNCFFRGPFLFWKIFFDSSRMVCYVMCIVMLLLQFCWFVCSFLSTWSWLWFESLE